MDRTELITKIIELTGHKTEHTPIIGGLNRLIEKYEQSDFMEIGRVRITIEKRHSRQQYGIPENHYNKIKHQLNTMIMDNPDQESGERPERPDDDGKG